MDEKEMKNRIIHIGDSKIYKLSMGTFLKTTKYRKADLIQQFDQNQWAVMGKNTAGGQGENWLTQAKIDDFAYITYGKDKLASIIKFTSEPNDLPAEINDIIGNDEFVYREYEVVAKPTIDNSRNLVNDKRGWLPSGYSTFKQISNLNEANQILFEPYFNITIVSDEKSDSEDNQIMNSKEKTQPLNQILYGPPGTGKTYSSKELAVNIAAPSFKIEKSLTAKEKRQKINVKYQELYDNGQIIFTTFHQSFSYEDFIEGIKPETIDKKVTYDTIPGLFKEFCEKADTKSDSNFEEVLSKFKADLIEKEVIKIQTRTIEFDVFYKGGKTFKINPKESKNTNPQYPASIENILKLYKGEDDDSMYNPSYVKGILNYLYENYQLKLYETIASGNDKNFVLIVDEINRGNVSAIFGELITLLEPDKRIGGDEAIKIVLPYSKTEFGIPSNLYLIGTMNTADRSVEALDTALRRRFSFKEIMPNPALLRNIAFDDFNLEEVLHTINERIKFLLDRDHTIGHSYFMNVESGDTEALEAVFKNKVIPLLQEYFYHDYEKIALILGSGFVNVKTNHSIEFPSFEDINEPDNVTLFELKSEIANIEEAIRLLLNKNAQ